MPNATPKLDVLISPFGTEPQPILSLAVHAERAGFDGVWTYDHMTGNMFDRGSSLDAFTLLGAIAGATERVQLGPLVANVINRHPVRLALIANTLHRTQRRSSRDWHRHGSGSGRPVLARTRNPGNRTRERCRAPREADRGDRAHASLVGGRYRILRHVLQRR